MTLIVPQDSMEHANAVRDEIMEFIVDHSLTAQALTQHIDGVPVSGTVHHHEFRHHIKLDMVEGFTLAEAEDQRYAAINNFLTGIDSFLLEQLQSGTEFVPANDNRLLAIAAMHQVLCARAATPTVLLLPALTWQQWCDSSEMQKHLTLSTKLPEALVGKVGKIMGMQILTDSYRPVRNQLLKVPYLLGPDVGSYKLTYYPEAVTEQGFSMYFTLTLNINLEHVVKQVQTGE